MPSLTLREHLKRARAKVKPENCARTRKQAKDAANKRWYNYFMSKGEPLVAEKYIE
jgi:hypothetical protein